ncbi:hypothetical protein SAVIM40S_04280 [Streptomyces avidinii]
MCPYRAGRSPSAAVPGTGGCSAGGRPTGSSSVWRPSRRTSRRGSGWSAPAVRPSGADDHADARAADVRFHGGPGTACAVLDRPDQPEPRHVREDLVHRRTLAWCEGREREQAVQGGHVGRERVGPAVRPGTSGDRQQVVRRVRRSSRQIAVQVRRQPHDHRLEGVRVPGRPGQQLVFVRVHTRSPPRPPAVAASPRTCRLPARAFALPVAPPSRSPPWWLPGARRPRLLRAPGRSLSSAHDGHHHRAHGHRAPGPPRRTRLPPARRGRRRLVPRLPRRPRPAGRRRLVGLAAARGRGRLARPVGLPHRWRRPHRRHAAGTGETKANGRHRAGCAS